jgi:hypothetical protein
MKRAALITAGLILGTLLSWSSRADPTQTLTGEYRWEDRARGPLEAVFTATAEAHWNVAFHFTFQGQAHVYRGTATGSLTEGALEGQVWDESKSQAYIFRGKAQKGAFRGTHAEVDDGKEHELGTLTLNVRP